MNEIAIILFAIFVVLAPFTAFAVDSPPDPAAIPEQAVAQASQEIEKAFAQSDPGEEIGKAIGDAMGSMDSVPGSGMDQIVPIMGIVGVFIAPIAAIIIIVMLAFRHRDRKEQRNHETIRQMIEKGIPIPPDLSFGDTAEKGSPLNKGLKYMGTGAGLIVFFLMMGMGGLAGIGAIPLFIGLAYLLIWHLDKNKTDAGRAG